MVLCCFVVNQDTLLYVDVMEQNVPGGKEVSMEQRQHACDIRLPVYCYHFRSASLPKCQ